MRALVVSLKCMYRGIHKYRTSKGVCSKVCICCFSEVIALLKTYKGEDRDQKFDLFERK